MSAGNRPRHRAFVPPSDPDTKIWRYMDFTGFVDMLSHAGLFFCRVDRFDDPFEGSIPRRWLEESKIEDDSLGNTGISRPAIVAISREELLKQRPWVLVNCWHMNEGESVAMWKLYAGSSRAICIQSTYGKLDEALDSGLFIGKVNYISYEDDDIPIGNLFWPIMHKRKSFEHERELRAVSCDVPSATTGNNAPPEYGEWRSVDLDALIDVVYVAPSAPRWFAELVENVSKKYDLQKPVKHSSLDAEPLR